MPGKILLSLLVASSLGAATVRLPMSPCMVTNTADTKACQPGCCANKSCCRTSHKRTSIPSQPLAKGDVGQDLTPAIVQSVTASSLIEIASPGQAHAHVLMVAHPPPTRVLLCTFLI
jgi:hypothetical protein